MKYVLKDFELPVHVTKLAHLQYFEFANNYHTMEDRHDFYELVYVDNGCLNILSDRYTGKLNQRQMILHLPNDSHSLFCDNHIAPEVIIVSFCCDCANVEELIELATAPTTLEGMTQKLLEEIVREGMSVFAPPYDIPNMPEMNKRKSFPFGADQMIKNLLEEFLILLIRNVNKQKLIPSDSLNEDDEFIESLKNYIKENLTTHITIGELCLIFNTNKTTLHEVFRNKTGETIVHYINRLRIRAAKRLIRENKMTFTQIAESTGFSSVHYFNRVFIKYEQMTPSQYSMTILSRLSIDDE